MRSIWKGAISFGLVTIPIRVLGATENHSVSFRQLHQPDGGRIRYRKVCELDGEEVGGAEITKGYEAPDGQVVQISDEELANLPLPTSKTVEILGFVAVDSIALIQLDRSYYLAPDTGAEKPYVLLRRAMERGGKGAIAKLAMRGRETLALLRPGADEVLGMHTMLWPDEIRSAEGIAPSSGVTIRDEELDLADRLMESLGDVDVAGLRDEYRDAVETLVTAKLSGTEPEEVPAAPRGGQVIDLMAALEDSVRAARESRGEDEAADGERTATVTELNSRTGGGTEQEAEAAGKPSGGKSRGKKAAAKTTTTKKKSPAGKSAAKKPSGTRSTAARNTPAKSSAKKSGTKKASAKKSPSNSGAKKTAEATARKKPTASGKRSAAS